MTATATAPASSHTLSTADILTAGLATFTLSGKGRHYTFRIERVEGSEGRSPIYFAKVLAGPDNDQDYVYMGVYLPDAGWLRLTKASKLTEQTECVRAFRWFVGLVFNVQEHMVEANGFEVRWAAECQRCGRTLTVPSSIDARLGPECAKKVGL